MKLDTDTPGWFGGLVEIGRTMLEDTAARGENFYPKIVWASQASQIEMGQYMGGFEELLAFCAFIHEKGLIDWICLTSDTYQLISDGEHPTPEQAEAVRRHSEGTSLGEMFAEGNSLITEALSIVAVLRDDDGAVHVVSRIYPYQRDDAKVVWGESIDREGAEIDGRIVKALTTTIEESWK